MDRHKNTTAVQLAINAVENVQIVCRETEETAEKGLLYKKGRYDAPGRRPASLLVH